MDEQLAKATIEKFEALTKEQRELMAAPVKDALDIQLRTLKSRSEIPMHSDEEAQLLAEFDMNEFKANLQEAKKKIVAISIDFGFTPEEADHNSDVAISAAQNVYGRICALEALNILKKINNHLS